MTKTITLLFCVLSIPSILWAQEERASTTLEPTKAQLTHLHTKVLEKRIFATTLLAEGTESFSDDESIPLYPPYPGRLLSIKVTLGQTVRPGDLLYTVESPDFIQAQTTLISSYQSYLVATKALKRADTLHQTHAISEKDYLQAISDQASSEGALHAAERAYAIFGQSDAAKQNLLKTQHIIPALSVHSPITGQVSSRSAAVMGFVQPGTPPAPITLNNPHELWWTASVPESDSLNVYLGDNADIQIMSNPSLNTTGRVELIAPTMDPITHRLLLRLKVTPPNTPIPSGLLVQYRIHHQSSTPIVALPVNGAVRQNDGSFTAWVTTDGRHFTQKNVQLGIEDNGYYPVLSGLDAQEQVVTDGAILLDHETELAGQ